MTSPFQQGDKVVAYCRYSEGDEQGLKNTSTEEQADAIRKFCEENRLQLVTIYADPLGIILLLATFGNLVCFAIKKRVPVFPDLTTPVFSAFRRLMFLL